MAKARQDLVSLIPGEVDTSIKPTVPDESYSIKDLIYFFPDLLIGGGQDFVASVLGTGKGIAEGIASENYGTQEGVREAEKSATEFMQKYGAKPKSRAASDFKQSIANYLADTGYDKFAVMDPRLFTTPLPGPASTRFATVKSAEAADDFLEDQYRKQAEGEGGQAAQMLRSVLPPRLDIFQGAKSQTFDKKSAEIFEKAEKEAIAENPDLSRYKLNKIAWQKTADAVERGEVQFPTFRGLDNQIRQEVPDTGFSFILPFTTYQKPKNKTGVFEEPKKRFYDEGASVPKGMEDPYKIKNLDKLIDFPQLFKAYDDLQKEKVKFVDKTIFDPDNPYKEIDLNYRVKDPASGQRDSEKRMIKVTPSREEDLALVEPPPFQNKPSPEKTYKSTLLHEIQHAIQEAEGFARGTSPNIIKSDLLYLRNALKEKKQKIELEIKEKNKKVLVAGSSKEKIRKEQEKQNKQRQKQINVINDLIHQTEFQLNALKTNQVDPLDLYRINFGEIESRIVQERQNLSMAQRLKKFPLERFFNKKGESFVFDDKTIRFLFDNKPTYGLSLFEKNVPVLSNIRGKDLEQKKDRDRNLTNFIIQQLSPRQARDLGFDKD